MIDSDLVSKLLEYDSNGKDGIQEMRDLLKQEGGISRLLGIAERVIKKPVRAKKPKQAALDILPPWLPLTEWNAYVKMRDRIKAPLTDEAKVLTFNKLEKFKADGSCGNGLHLCAQPVRSLGYMPEATKYVGCPVLLAEINVIDESKVKVPRVVEPGCYEVDIDGVRK